nr:serine hydrolase [Ornithinimicrobium sp. HY1745]
MDLVVSSTLDLWHHQLQHVDGEWSLCALGQGVDLRDNADVRHPSASIIKLPIMATVLDRVRAGHLGLSDRVDIGPSDRVGGAGVLQHLDVASLTVLQSLSLMITISDNVATNALINHLGLAEFRQAWGHPLFEGFELNRLMMHAASTPEQDNFASAAAAVRLLLDLDDKASSGDDCAQLALDILGQQQIRDRIPSLLPDDVTCLNKTGELVGTRHDIALLRRGGATTAVAMLSSGVSGVAASSGGGVPAHIMGRTAAALVQEFTPTVHPG